MNWKYIFDIKDILNYLTKSNGHFLVFVSQVKTNFNLNKKHFFLNYDDLFYCSELLKKMKEPPLEIVLEPYLEKNYEFERKKKILRVQQITFKPLSPFDEALAKAKQIVFGASKANLDPFEVALKKAEEIIQRNEKHHD